MATTERNEETIFTRGAPPLKFGEGACDEVGFELSGHGVRRALIVTDAGVHALGIPQRIADNLRRYEIEAEIFDGVHIEPTDDSMTKATEYARAQGPGTGSSPSAAGRRSTPPRRSRC
jgi:hydroxyacid-oxoacid transhydrogenase